MVLWAHSECARTPKAAQCSYGCKIYMGQYLWMSGSLASSTSLGSPVRLRRPLGGEFLTYYSALRITMMFEWAATHLGILSLNSMSRVNRRWGGRWRPLIWAYSTWGWIRSDHPSMHIHSFEPHACFLKGICHTEFRGHTLAVQDHCKALELVKWHDDELDGAQYTNGGL
ncbi:hypothetical protein AG1IA_07939 [Rhizoctonia solani AG-1 IA]|uniref:Uncharacterized protein n=1 Tax=Thanatephorus cucumeris (strain AG1-IA) TaxID=983506 RepID=L8WML5_THACA|nr:hypothetical protein AG1IA_07939 [Rhizoctonia solani AG-1 IA]